MACAACSWHCGRVPFTARAAPCPESCVSPGAVSANAASLQRPLQSAVYRDWCEQPASHPCDVPTVACTDSHHSAGVLKGPRRQRGPGRRHQADGCHAPAPVGTFQLPCQSHQQHQVAHQVLKASVDDCCTRSSESVGAGIIDRTPAAVDSPAGAGMQGRPGLEMRGGDGCRLWVPIECLSL